MSARDAWATTPPHGGAPLAPGARRWSAAHAHLADLAAVRTFVGAACEAAGLDAESCDALVLATDEVCANVIVHGYAGRDARPLEVVVAGDAREVRVTVSDAGPPFDPDALPPPELGGDWAARVPGGLGWYLVRRVVDDVGYERTDGGNRLTLVKHRPSAG